MHKNKQHIISQLYRPELPESPIGHHDFPSDSPQPQASAFLYPASYQPPVTPPKHLNLKITVTNLLSQLKDWLVELCLSDHCINEVDEQLGPIIEEMIELGQQQDSYWVETLNFRDSKEERENCFVSSGVSQEGKYLSLLINDSRAQVALLGEGQKNLIKMYFRRYYRLFQNCMGRIKRLSGEKKLKFLVDTTVKNIFSQTLRVSYHLKLVEHRINQQKQLKIDNNKNGHLRVLAQRTRSLLIERGNVRYAFKRMRVQWEQGIKRDGIFVRSMLGNITKLCSLYEKNRKWGLTTHFFNWRQSSLSLKIKQDQCLVQVVRSMSQDMMASLEPLLSLSQFRLNWRSALQNQFAALIESLFGSEECLFMSMEALMRQPRLERCSIFQLLEQQESCFTHRSNSKHWKEEYPFVGEFSLEELKNCVISGQIYRNQQSQNNLLLVPVKAVPGILFVSLAEPSPNQSMSFRKTPMTLRSFRKLLRLIQLSSPLLEQMSTLCRRVEEQWEYIECEGHIKELFREFTKTDLAVGTMNEGHLQISQRGLEGIEIDSHRLDSPAVINQVMDRFSLSSLMIYHRNRDGLLNELPCVTVGSQELSIAQKSIIRSMDQELLTNGKETLIINRNHRSFMVMPLKREGNNIGLIHCVVGEEEVRTEVVRDCLVPLLMKYQGKMDCQLCQVSINLPIESEGVESMMKDQSIRVDFQHSLTLVTAHDVPQLQSAISSILNNQGHFFSKLLLKLDPSDPLNYFHTSSQDTLHFLNLSPSDQPAHTSTTVEQYRSISAAGPFGKLVHQHPCFDNVQLHLYQNENINRFRVISVPIKKSGQGTYGYWLVGHYLSQGEKQVEHDERVIEWVKSIASRVAMNPMFKHTQMRMIAQLLKQTQAKRMVSQLEQRVSRWTGRGKLLHQLRQFSLKFQNEADFVLAKLTSQGQIVPLEKRQRSCQLSEQLSSLLSTKQAVTSHQKILSFVHNSKKHHPSRTIRPFDPLKLANTALLLPPLPSPLKQQLASKIKEQYQLEGWMSTEYLPELQKISREVGMKGQEERLLQMMMVGESNNDNYLVLLSRKIDDVQGVEQTESTLLQAIALKYNRILASSIQSLPTMEKKQKAVLSLLNVLPANDPSLQTCLNQFKAMRATIHNNTQTVSKILSVVLHPELQKGHRYISHLRQAFVKISQRSHKVKDVYECWAWRTGKIIEKSLLRMQYRIGFDSIYESISKKYDGHSFPQIRATQSIVRTLVSLNRAHAHSALSLLSLYQRHKHQNTLTSKHLSLQLLYHTCLTLYTARIRHLFTQRSVLSAAFRNNISLVGQQFSKLTFASRQNFIRYANERFETVLQHLEYAVVRKVEIGCCLRAGNEWVIYRIGKEGEFQERRSQNICSETNNWESILLQNSNKHGIIFKIYTKNNLKAVDELATLKKVIYQGLLPCYSSYLETTLAKTYKLASTLQALFCKQLWNGSATHPQKVYAFHDKPVEQQADKLRFMGRLKSIRQQMSIAESKLIASAISTQSKLLYNLGYQYSALSGLLAGTYSPTQQDESALSKYGEVVTREQLAKERQQLEQLENQEQGRTLQYQIKSKTFATCKIITFLEKRANGEVEKDTCTYLRNSQGDKENRRNNAEEMEKTVVQKKLALNDLKDKIRREDQKQKKTASRAIFLTLGRMLRSHQKKEIGHYFHTLILPRRSSIRA